MSPFRRRSLFRCVAVVALPLVGAPLFAQGETGFLRGEGKLDIVAAYAVDSYDEFWVGSNKLSDPAVGEVERKVYALYSAYGLTDEADLILAGAYVEAESDGIGGFPDESDLQDLLLAAKWRVYEQPVGGGSFSLALLPGIKVPMTDYEDNAVTAIGDGQVDLRGRVVGQLELANGAFAALETGYDRRNGSPDDEVPINLTIGATIAQRLTVAPFLSRVESLGGTDIGAPGGFPTNEEDYTRAGLSLYWRLSERYGLTGSWRTTLDGRNTGDVDGFSVGFVLRAL